MENSYKFMKILYNFFMNEFCLGDIVFDYKVIKFINDKHGDDYCILENDTEYILAIQGTDPKEMGDLKTNLLLFRDEEKSPSGKTFKVHHGYNEDAKNILYVEHESILNAFQNKKKITIIGHSLGGAIAEMIGLYLSFENIETKVYAYGPPAIGDSSIIKVFEEYMKNNTIIYCVTEDIIPSLIFFNEHPSDVMYMNKDGSIKKSTNSLFVKLIRYVSSIIKYKSFKNILEPHQLETYLDYLEKSCIIS